MLIFKDGVLKTIDNIPSSMDSFKTAIVDNFKDAEEPEPPKPDPEKLI